MTHKQQITLATWIAIATGTLWGGYWIPVRRLEESGLTGAWGTLGIVVAAALLLCPFGITGFQRLRAASPVALITVALGGVAFVFYSTGFIYGRVSIIVLLFFLSPVWSTLIGHYLMGWATPPMRIAALLVGIAGLGLMLGAQGQLPVPRNIGEWLGLASGVLWSISTIGIRSKVKMKPGETAFVFAVGGVIGAALLAPLLEPLPAVPEAGHMASVLAWTFAAAGLWWGVSMVGLVWAAQRLEPARIGILLMAEVLVGTVTAALMASEQLGPLEMLGGALVLCAGVLEVWPVRAKTRVKAA
jgi:drug/metabolite transporter (DMT)-like permease